MDSVWDIIYLRRPVLNYVSPPVCEVIFSGSSSPIIVLSEHAIGKVTGLALGGVGNFDLSWNAFPGAICYNVYYIGGDNIAVPLAQCVTDPFFTLPPGLDPGIIVVTAITLEGEGPPSDPVPYPSAPPSGIVTVETECPQVSVDNFPVNFLIQRNNTSGNLTVNFSMGGTAINGADYQAVPLSVIISNGSSIASVAITPIEGFAPTKTATLFLEPGGYTIGSPSAADLLMRPAYFKITNYGGAEPFFQQSSAATPVDFCEWDGSFTNEDLISFAPNSVWSAEDVDGGYLFLPEIAVDGKQVAFLRITRNVVVFPARYDLDLYGYDSNLAQFEPIWTGTKLGVITAVGVYTRTGGNDLRPSVSIEAVP